MIDPKELEKKIKVESVEEIAEKYTKEMKSILSDLKAFKPKVDVAYHLNDLGEIKALKEAVNELNKRVNIPDEIKLTKRTENVYTLKDRAKKWLIGYCLISFVVVAISLCFGINGIVIDRRPRNATADEIHNWKVFGRIEAYNLLPENSQNYLQRKKANTDFFEYRK